MVFVYFLLWLQVELIVHWYFIKVRKIDITPDDKFVTWSKFIVVVFRTVPVIALYWFVVPKSPFEGILFFTTCFLLHLLIFPIQLNLYMGKPLHYLGKGLFDRILGLVPSLVFRVFILSLLASGAWHAYFNTDLF